MVQQGHITDPVALRRAREGAGAGDRLLPGPLTAEEPDRPAGVEDREKALADLLRQMGSVVVAYSGGVDSAYLADVAQEALGDRSLAVTAASASVAPDELEAAIYLASERGWRHRVISTSELDEPGYAENGPRRCFFCKTELYVQLGSLASEAGISVIVNGANTDDLGDYRPGLTAAANYSVRSPLVEAGLNKNAIRVLSRARGLPTWDKPAQPCLSSRIPYGTRVTVEALSRIGRAERALKSLGFRELRVRHYGESARVEISPSEMAALEEQGVPERVISAVRSAGYASVEIDPEGFRSGKLNAVITGRAGARDAALAAN